MGPMLSLSVLVAQLATFLASSSASTTSVSVSVGGTTVLGASTSGGLEFFAGRSK
jgi:hypothetical protein